MRILVVAAVVVFACSACSGGKKARATLVRVPDLRGLPTQKALERVAGAGLCVWHVDREQEIALGAERVVAQRPAAGTLVRRLRRISFVIGGSSPNGEVFGIVVARGCDLPPLPLFRDSSVTYNVASPNGAVR